MQGNDIKLSIGVILGSIVLVVGIVLVARVFDTPDSVATNETVGDATHVEGNPSSENTVVEFSDFQCPSCRAAYPELKRFVEAYKDQIRVVYRHFPLPQHQNSKPAAYAAEAASRQGKFWEAHDWLFDHQNEWAEATASAEYFYDKFGSDLGLEKEKFVIDYTSDEVRSAVQKDLEAANKLGANSTPTFFVNGKKQSGVMAFDDLVKQTNVTAVTTAPTAAAPTETVTPAP